MAWVCGNPCSSSSGGPEPPRRRRMETSSVSTVSSWNPSNTSPSSLALVGGQHLEAPCDAFTGVIHEREYVLARFDVQRLLVKSVRFAKVSAVEMPVERGLGAARDGLEHRPALFAVELGWNQYAGIRVGVEHRECGPASFGLTIGAQRRQRAILGVRAAVVILLGRRQHEPAGMTHPKRRLAVAVDAPGLRVEMHAQVVRTERIEVAVSRHPGAFGLAVRGGEEA